MRKINWLVVVFFVAALAGFADASYLTTQHLQGSIPPCAIDGCDQVLTSAYATIGPMPVAALGMLYYGTILVLIIAFWDTGSRKLLKMASALVGLGILSTLYLIYLQAFVIDSWCVYCLFSAAMTLIMGIVAFSLRPFSSVQD
jgi:uncharacterized membrane protein